MIQRKKNIFHYITTSRCNFDTPNLYSGSTADTRVTGFVIANTYDQTANQSIKTTSIKKLNR